MRVLPEALLGNLVERHEHMSPALAGVDAAPRRRAAPAGRVGHVLIWMTVIACDVR